MTKKSLNYPFKQAPLPGELVEICKGLYWLRMKIPFQLDHINLWLVEGETSWAIVDTGTKSDETREAWETIFDRYLNGKPVDSVVVTHMHPDHVGMAGWLCERWQVDVTMTKTEWLYTQIGGDLALKHQSSYSEHYQRLGVEEKVVENLHKMYSFYSHLMEPLPGTFRRMAGGDVVKIGGLDWKVMIGLGHSPEHACLYCEEKNVIIGGDQLLPGITPSISVSVEEIDSDPLKEFLESLEQFYSLPEDVLVLPSHQLPYRGVHLRIDQLKAHHSSRCDMLIEACVEPKNAFDLVDVLFGHRKLSPMDKLMALGETIAHANMLLNEGRLYRYLDGNQQYLFVLPESVT